MSSQSYTLRLINATDPPDHPLPTELGPATQVACFSICKEHLEIDSTTALRYFVHPPSNANFNLRDGLERFLKLPFRDRAFKRARRLDNVFAMCLSSKNSEELLKADVVTWRGIMNKIMRGEAIDLNVSYYPGVLYLEEANMNAQFDHNSEGTYMGRVLYSDPFSIAVSNIRVNAAVTRKLGSLSLLVVGEVDCVKGFMSDIKRGLFGTSWARKLCGTQDKEIGCWKDRDESKASNAMHNQSTPEIFVGFPDSAGIIRGFRTLAVPKEQSQPFQGKIAWGARVLHALIGHCSISPMPVEEGILKVWRVQTRSKYVDIRELAAGEVKNLNRGGVPRNGIIPMSFIEGLDEKRRLHDGQLSS
ncbi:hypothetical protein C8R43DRAFT_950970 [Mycena crocata]|nr:hypothetical protein C8R43DRAFT_950970 [Mycena crocata]